MLINYETRSQRYQLKETHRLQVCRGLKKLNRRVDFFLGFRDRDLILSRLDNNSNNSSSSSVNSSHRH